MTITFSLFRGATATSFVLAVVVGVLWAISYPNRPAWPAVDRRCPSLMIPSSEWIYRLSTISFKGRLHFFVARWRHQPAIGGDPAIFQMVQNHRPSSSEFKLADQGGELELFRWDLERFDPWSKYDSFDHAGIKAFHQYTGGHCFGLRLPHAYVIALLLLLPLTAGLKKIRRKRRRMAGRCLQCGYDLRATPETCPECGALARAETGTAAPPQRSR